MITIQIASLPEREKLLEKTINSLRGQCDKIFVALNIYSHTPHFLKDDEYIHLDNSTGDAGKFYGIENIKGYIFTCDDDLIYPSNYVQYMIAGVEKYGCPCTMHGKTFNAGAKFNHPLALYRCLDEVKSDGRVDVGGTGVMCWHSDQLKIGYSDFKIRNMADLWFAKLCKEQGVRIMCLAHQKGNLKYQGPVYTIWDEEKKKGFKLQSKVLKSFLCK
jgi:hypothetical protein